MRYRLDETHYVGFLELPAGTEVGDGCAESWKFPDTIDNVALRGKYMAPSMSMTPLDDEAKAAFAAKFGLEPPERDPTKKIPIMGVDPSATGTAAPPSGNAFTGKPPTVPGKAKS